LLFIFTCKLHQSEDFDLADYDVLSNIHVTEHTMEEIIVTIFWLEFSPISLCGVLASLDYIDRVPFLVVRIWQASDD
jgi:hypothetical protein